MKKRTLEELNVLDDFLFQELISRGKKGEDFCRILLETILGRKIGKVTVTPQKPLLGMDTNLHGIRMDAYIEVTESETNVQLEPDIYDIEPNKVADKRTLPKRTRYYQGLIDSRLLESGVDYEHLKNVVIIMILPYDPFDKNRMMYTVKNLCVEEPDIPYEDGIKKIFLYTRGTEGTPSQELQEMLQYIENSVAENVTNPEIAAIHNYVNEVKRDRKAGIQYMKSWEHDKMMRDEGREEGREEGKRLGLAEAQKQIDRINALNQKLAEDGRMEDIIMASSNKEYQKKLLVEFGL